MTSQAVEETQKEQFKRRKVGDALKGTIDSLFIKKKQLADAQYQAFKIEISCQDRLKNLWEQLESCKKKLKEKRICTKQLEVSLS